MKLRLVPDPSAAKGVYQGWLEMLDDEGMICWRKWTGLVEADVWVTLALACAAVG